MIVLELDFENLTRLAGTSFCFAVMAWIVCIIYVILIDQQIVGITNNKNKKIRKQQWKLSLSLSLFKKLLYQYHPLLKRNIDMVND